MRDVLREMCYERRVMRDVLRETCYERRVMLQGTRDRWGAVTRR